MSSTLAATLFIACPLIGAVCALFGQYTRWWQVLFGAVVGAAVADMIFRTISTRLIQSAMSGKAVGVVVWSTDVDLSNRLIGNAILLAIAVIVGGFVLLVHRFAARPN